MAGNFLAQKRVGVVWCVSLGRCIYPFLRVAFVLLFCVGTKAGIANINIAALFELAQAPVVSDAHRFASGRISADLCAFDGGLRITAK